jgi:hypothetical protein
MFEAQWQTILAELHQLQAGAMAELECDEASLLVERRDDIFIALREIPTDYPRAELLQLSAKLRLWQVLEVNGTRYLCGSSRGHISADTLRRLATFHF